MGVVTGLTVPIVVEFQIKVPYTSYESHDLQHGSATEEKFVTQKKNNNNNTTARQQRER